MNSPAPRRRRWLLYGLGGLLLLVLATAVGLITARQIWRSREQAQQRAAAAAVERLGGEVQHAFASGASPLSMFLEQGDAPNVFHLSSKKLTDDDLVIFESAPTTRALWLFDNQIADNGLVHLRGLTQLENLDLRRNKITDAGLVHLEGLRNLKNLYLIRTQVTPAGVARLQKKLPNTKIAH